MEPETNTLTMVATDGHRLALSTIPSQLPITKGFTLPRKAAEELIRLIKPEDSNLNIDISDKTLTVSTTHSTIQMRLLDGDYPNWKKVIPTNPATTITLNKKDLISSIRRVQVFTTDQNKGITIAISPNEMILSASHPDLGQATDMLPIDYSGDNIIFIINADYLLEALSQFNESVTLNYHEEGAPIVFRESPGYFNLIMPMRK